MVLCVATGKDNYIRYGLLYNNIYKIKGKGIIKVAYEIIFLTISRKNAFNVLIDLWLKKNRRKDEGEDFEKQIFIYFHFPVQLLKTS